MTVRQAIVIVAGCALIGMSVGFGVGYALGTYAPDFIRALFPLSKPDANLAQIGIGLGTVNGGFIGIGIGAFVVGVLAWLKTKTQ